MRILFCIMLACLIGSATQIVNGQDDGAYVRLKKIMNIVPAESNAEDVKTLLGEPFDELPSFYRFDDINVQISYASGLPCDALCVERGRASSWMVPRDTVITIAIIVKVALHEKDLTFFDIDLKEFKKGNPDHIGTVHYSNEEAGIGVDLNGSQVASISLFPAKKYFHLMCPKSSNKPVCPRQPC